jgi:hypothetical protein
VRSFEGMETTQAPRGTRAVGLVRDVLLVVATGMVTTLPVVIASGLLKH